MENGEPPDETYGSNEAHTDDQSTRLRKVKRGDPGSVYSFGYVHYTETGFPIRTHVVETRDVSLDGILEAFRDHLRACGFSIRGDIVVEGPEWNDNDGG